MNILFVVSGNSVNYGVAPFIKSQADSLIKKGLNIRFYPIVRKGMSGYLGSALKLKKYVKENHIDIIHSHYTLSGITAVLAMTGKPVVHSFMGSDVYGIFVDQNKVKLTSRYLTLLTFMIQPFLDGIISKSPNIDRYVYLKSKAEIIPNGIDLNALNKIQGCRKEKMGLDPKKQYVLFLGDRSSKRKNFRLLENAVKNLNRRNLEILAPYPIAHKKVIELLKTVDVFAMSSFMEGSPNSVKEAMACNCPMVVTNVGDAAWVVGNTPGCYVSSFKVDDYAAKLACVLDFAKENKRTNGIERINELGLSSEAIADRIIATYKKIQK